MPRFWRALESLARIGSADVSGVSAPVAPVRRGA